MAKGFLHGVSIADTNASHVLTILVGSNLTADRNFTLTTGDAARTLTVSADATVSQDYSTTASPQFAGVEVGHASDTTLTRSSAGNLAVEGNVIYRAGGTDVALADGGTGASLADPNADRILFWDDSAGAVTWLVATHGLAITTTALDVSLVNADTIITSGHTITSAAGTYEDVTGLSVSLPAAGTYLVFISLRGQISFSAGSNGFVTARLDLNGSTVTNSETMIVFGAGTGVVYTQTAGRAFVVTAAGAHTLKVQAKRDGTGMTFTGASIAADANGKSAITYVRLA